MLKREYAVLVSSLIIGVSLISGCTKSTEQTSSDLQQPAGTTVTERNANNRNFQGPDLMGEVTSVSGNQLELKLIEMPQGGQFAQNGQRRQGGQAGEEQGLGRGEGQGQRQEQGQEQGQGQPQGQGPAQGLEQNQKIKQNDVANPEITRLPRQPRQMNYTGENTTITVPEGLVITTNGRNRIGNNMGSGNPGNENSNNVNPNIVNPNIVNPNNGNASASDGNSNNDNKVDIKDIKSGDVIQVWYSDPNSKTISRISVRPSIDGTNAKQ